MFFNGNGSPCYRGRDPSGHILYDIWYCDACEESRYDDDDEISSRMKRKGKKSSEQVPKERYEAGDPAVDLIGEPSGKFDFYVIYRDVKPTPPAKISLCSP